MSSESQSDTNAEISTDKMIPLVEDSDGCVLFFLEVENQADHFIDGKVYEVDGWCDDGNGDFTVPADLEEYLNFYIKWDGCSHISLDDKVMTHLCGQRCWVNHVKMLKSLWEYAAANIASFNADVADYESGEWGV